MKRAKDKTKAKKRDPNQINIVGNPSEDKAVAIAHTIIQPTVQAAVTIKQYGKTFGDLDLPGLIDALTVQTEAATKGELERGEEMLTAQAHILDAIFNNLARRAINSDLMDQLDRYLKLALRAQSQCRTTWEALTAMKNPPIVGYVRQANIAHGNLQVNIESSKTDDQANVRENTKLQSKLLELNHGERLDISETGATGQANPAVATVGEVNGAKDAGG